jgi:AP-4 complex subunit epsilon-1
VSELAERYAPSPAWFIRVVSEVFELGGEHVEPALAHSLMRLIAEQDEALHRSAVDIYARLLDAESSARLPDVLLQVLVWVLGEYGSLAATNGGPRALSAQQVSTLPVMSPQL